MKRIKILAATAWTTFSLLLVGSQPLQVAQAADSNIAACQLATLQGNYDFVAPATITIGAGTVIAIPEELLYASPAVYASKGSLTFDGDGKISLNAVETSQGVLASPISYPALFTLNGDCTGMAAFGNGTQLELKMVGGGEAQTLVSTTPGFVILRPGLTSSQ